MDKISIKNLNPKSKCLNKPLSIQTLRNPKETKRKADIEFNVEQLRTVREEFKQRVINLYKKQFKRCLDKITEVNKKCITDMIFDPPQFIFGEDQYNLVNCAYFIDKRLQKLGMETIILPGARIYVSWEHL